MQLNIYLNKRSFSPKIRHRFSMAIFLFSLFLMMLASLTPAPLSAKINVVASIPDLGDMARIIGGDRVRVTVLATGKEDLHAVPVRPSFLVKLNRADLLLNLGFSAEHAWLDALAKEARNRRIAPDAEGWIEVGQGITILEKPRILDRAEGHQHPQGNPHYNIGPDQGKVIARNIANAFIAFDPANKAFYESNLNNYLSELQKKANELREQGKALAGVNTISFHADTIYLTEFYGMKNVANLEPKPGVQPSAGHLQRLRQIIKQKKVRLILYNQAQNPAIPKKLASEAGIRAVQFANMVGARPEIKTWLDLQSYNLQQLLKGLQ